MSSSGMDCRPVLSSQALSSVETDGDRSVSVWYMVEHPWSAARSYKVYRMARADRTQQPGQVGATKGEVSGCSPPLADACSVAPGLSVGLGHIDELTLVYLGHLPTIRRQRCLLGVVHRRRRHRDEVADRQVAAVLVGPVVPPAGAGAVPHPAAPAT